MSILHKDICSGPMCYVGAEFEACGITFQPGTVYYVYSTMNRLTRKVTAYISLPAVIDMLGYHGIDYRSRVIIPYANANVFYKIWKPFF